jgi:hypothetical protein
MSSKDLVKYLRYKDEFLRRNKDYLKACLKADRDIKKYLMSKHPQGGVTDYPDEDIEEVTGIINRVRKKWGAYHDFNTGPFYDEAEKMDTPAGMRAASLLLHQLMPLDLKPVVRPLNVRLAEDQFCFTGEDLDKGKVILEVDLTHTKKRLIEAFETVIRAMQYSYKLAAPQGKAKKRETTHKKKFHFDNFDLYLKVWDMRSQKPKVPWSKIASALPKPRDRKTDFTTQDARNYKKAADRLIKEGIDAYVK